MAEVAWRRAAAPGLRYLFGTETRTRGSADRDHDAADK